MTANRRIFLNIVATYGRSLYALAIGLFCGRWTLMSLGEVDYGLVGVVGGMAGFVSFLNGLMSSAVSRFYAFSVGAAEKNPGEGIEECRRWFNTALLIHTTLPIVLIAIGYPCGVWAIQHYLTIPITRIDACIWVWRFVCISCFIGMINVPFQAMYTAKQEIAELTIYSFGTTTLNFIFVWYMVTHPAIWLTKYMAWTCAVSVVPQLIIAIRAVIKYPECRFNPRYIWNNRRLLDIINYSGGKFICAFSQMMSSQGTNILVNKILGPTRNAAMSVGSTVAGHCSSLSYSLLGAYFPAIVNAAGSRDLDRMRRLMYITCLSSSAAILLFLLPLFLEINEVMHLWLKVPPQGAGALCLCLMFVELADSTSVGLWMGIFALGKIFVYQMWESFLWFAVLPLAYVFIKMNFGILGVGMAMVLAKVLAVFMKLYFSRKLCGISVRKWLFRIALPLGGVALFALCGGLLPRFTMAPSFWRVVATTVCVEIVYLPLCWKYILPYEVRQKIAERILSKLKNVVGRKIAHGKQES